ncbi:hypothetical protein K443DRAFT_335528 [Laccaria amethystina LaAM-08-1]|uniref:Unplaced genomic scaffold K443scaffold_23, whole genome shotgun sequence n=1 Tax=Laccaria amethystina LaAM-08-1 TaxID=1095629 RepID=A0A0C9YC09_9AGAR|nr:hypothetical protein K443DRAFT_335528 [Laccaria amethystina LaAM-08-1]
MYIPRPHPNLMIDDARRKTNERVNRETCRVYYSRLPRKLAPCYMERTLGCSSKSFMYVQTRYFGCQLSSVGWKNTHTVYDSLGVGWGLVCHLIITPSAGHLASNRRPRVSNVIPHCFSVHKILGTHSR